MNYSIKEHVLPDKIKEEIDAVYGMERLLKLDGFIAKSAEEKIFQVWLKYFNIRLGVYFLDEEKSIEFGSEVIRKIIKEYKENPKKNLQVMLKEEIDKKAKEMINKRREINGHNYSTERLQRDYLNTARCS